jgi:hypothetical protein
MRLPTPLQSYFDANATLDLEAMVASFTDKAIVHDEDRVHEGKDAIREWIRQATIASAAVAVPQAIVSAGRNREVTTETSGAFPGSPVTLTFRFVLDADGIAELEIK